ncbi:hypothetical protein RRG08_062317 [Elysia crispata]|uniref:Uncharacterized protein n=1 Tax=Elysia crispata TaxID=231223 RepID=A0AAE0YGP8_9GAST|nr:hypothetical protein RRG08_062317 [Elysia crispata]
MTGPNTTLLFNLKTNDPDATDKRIKHLKQMAEGHGPTDDKTRTVVVTSGQDEGGAGTADGSANSSEACRHLMNSVVDISLARRVDTLIPN